MEKNNFSHYEFEVGRKGYKPDNKSLVWNVIFNDFNGKKIVVENLFALNWHFANDILFAKKKYSNNFDLFSDYVRSCLQYYFWSRSEYEVVVSRWGYNSMCQEDLDELQRKLNKRKAEIDKMGWDCKPTVDKGYPDVSKKIDVYTQVMMNWDRFINYLWENKKLITKRKMDLL